MAGRKILIIEDEPVHLNVMKAKLEYEGYEVIVATDGETGYQKIMEEKPDLVLLDIILPKLDGFGIMERLRTKGKPAPTIIVVSNSGQPVEIDKALKLGAKDYLVKAEFNPADVLDKVEKALGPSVAEKKNGTRKSVPAEKLTVAPSADRNYSITGSGNKENILIVEDDKFLRDLIVQKLGREGFRTSEAMDGEEGLKAAKEMRPDLILLDLILPGMDGFEVLKRIKEDKVTAQIPVIVLSNLGQKEDMDRTVALGAEDFMVKAHFTPGEIITKIKVVLKKKYF
ncbi:MAG: Two component system response regulator, modulated diguanylate cyclase [Candidatus Giovannonibacteria bacterium GW2011_GWC2_44_9]|uniref:Two component system response regulator, modulated diguanylate cyclase n=3 Tax=Candidatus Giovannoniibacteriota TaxID=1752738 RepID=A0A0G1IWE6_9BACT|nr:MAG: Two component system response regulator, modulated diguanylate cyclase [Candidatus Giovannonibacteria bacterium GW2011_GWB1_44_23]KKT63415.1 MAG: Two component system response regulator, modulated diguanylate cyclase [Candidatus Giovannonibacteria bacterium GW2011_GWA1_44_29]KKT83714.1 MAG: Two component system response regulator, modulated diguanylate cyclase [Candidatus Giovannonibacteria bacterium GW2011_GWC2_44_9]KKT91475.1 MAG: Two-component sensor kinase [Parcubacteria group bacter